LEFLAKIEAGIAELDAGERIPHQEVKRRVGLRPTSSGPRRRCAISNRSAPTSPRIQRPMRRRRADRHGLPRITAVHPADRGL